MIKLFLYNLLISDKEFSDKNILKNIELVYKTALKNKVFIRTVDRLANLKIIENKPALYKSEMARKKKMLQFINNHLSELKHPHIFIKNFMHLPDIGDDIDLYLVGGDVPDDNVILNDLSYDKTRLSSLNKIGSRTQYYIKDYNIDLEIYHGAYGRIGEYNDNYGLFSSTSQIKIGSNSFIVPTIEDQILTQCIQSLYCTGNVRVSDIIFFIKNHKENNIDYDYLSFMGNKLHIRNGMLNYMGHINSIIKENCPSVNPIYYDANKKKNIVKKLNIITLIKINIIRFLSSLYQLDFVFSFKLILIPVLYLQSRILKAFKR